MEVPDQRACVIAEEAAPHVGRPVSASEQPREFAFVFQQHEQEHMGVDEGPLPRPLCFLRGERGVEAGGDVVEGRRLWFTLPVALRKFGEMRDIVPEGVRSRGIALGESGATVGLVEQVLRQFRLGRFSRRCLRDQSCQATSGDALEDRGERRCVVELDRCAECGGVMATEPLEVLTLVLVRLLRRTHRFDHGDGFET